MTDDDGNAFRRNGEAWMNWTDLARGVMYAVELILCVKVLGDWMMPAGRHGPDPSTGMARGLRAAGWILTVLYACGVGKSLMYLRFGWDDDVLPVDYVNLALVTANTLVWIVLAWRHRGR